MRNKGGVVLFFTLEKMERRVQELAQRRYFDMQTIAPLEEIKKKSYRICVAQGLSKVDSMLGALNGGIVNVLITSEETANMILRQDDYMNP